MTTFFIDSNATGANDGSTAADAWETFSVVVWTSFNPGDIIECRGFHVAAGGELGIIGAVDGTPDNPISFIGDPDGVKCIIDAENINRDCIDDAGDDYIYYRGFDCRNGDDGINGQGIVVQNSTGVVVEDCVCNGNLFDNFKFQGAIDCKLINPISTSGTLRGVTVSGAGSSPSDNITIIGGNVSGCERGLTISGGGAGDGGRNVSNIVIKGGVYHDNENGLSIDNGQNITLSATKILNNNLTGSNDGIESLDNCSDVTFTDGFEISGHAGRGIGLVFDVERIIFNNFVIKNNLEGVRFNSQGIGVLEDFLFINGEISGHSTFGILCDSVVMTRPQLINVNLFDNNVDIRMIGQWVDGTILKSSFTGTAAASIEMLTNAQLTLNLCFNVWTNITDQCIDSQAAAGATWIHSNNFYDNVSGPLVTLNSVNFTTDSEMAGYEFSRLTDLSEAGGFQPSGAGGAGGAIIGSIIDG